MSNPAPHERPRTLDPEIVLGVLTVVIVVASIPSVREIPGWGRSFGLDLWHVQAFHTCASRSSPYAATGLECGDRLVPFLQYPPLLYWSFVWTRFVSLSVGRWLWASFIAVVLLWLPLAWTRPDPLEGTPPRARSAVCLVGATLIAGFPALFAMERGNNDILVVLFWTLSFRWFQSNRSFLGGCAAGLATALKLYPLFSVAVVAAGLLGAASAGGRERRVAAIRFGAGLLLTIALVCLVFFDQTRQYLTLRLPVFAAHLPEVAIYSHSVPSTFRHPSGVARLVSGALLLVWTKVAFTSFARRTREVFAGALAISTYFAATSYDYNLITVYPLLFVLLEQAFARARPIDWRSSAVFVVGLVATIAHRGWLERFPVSHVVLQLVWLLLAAAWLTLPSRPVSSTTQ